MRKITILSAVIILSGCASEVVPIGKDSYMIAKDGSFTTFGGGAVKAELYKEAHAFCQKQNKQLQPLSAQSRDSGYGRYANAELQFRCLAENDAEFTRPNIEKEDLTIQIESD